MIREYETVVDSGPPPFTVFSTFISRKIGEAPNFRQIGGCLTESLPVWSYLSPGIFDEKMKVKKAVSGGGHVNSAGGQRE